MLKVNAQLRRGEFAMDIAFDQSSRVTGVFGPSGAGKSTLIEMIAGLATPDAGRIELDGETLFDSSSGVNLPPHKRRIGVMFQDDRLFPHMNVKANLLYARRLPKGRTALRLGPVEEWEFVQLLGLGDLLARRVSTLSGGERQRVALGRALFSEPKLLLLDEPLSSLDAGLKRQILPYLRKVRDAAGIPMLYVSHDLTEMLQVADHLLLLERGRMLAHGTYGEVAHAHAAIESLHESGLVNVLMAVCTASASDGGLTLALDYGTSAEAIRSAGAFNPTIRAAIGTPVSTGAVVTIVIRASDVAIALQQVQGVSIQNQLRGEIRRLTAHRGRVIVEVDIGRPLLAELTQRAVENLGLKPGLIVWCLIKSNAVRLAT